jgi:hypothetical protein
MTPIAATICAIALIVSRFTRDLYQIASRVTMSILFRMFYFRRKIGQDAGR